MILAVCAITFTYNFSAEIEYDFKATLDGYLPMMGGMDTKAEVAMGLSVKPLPKLQEGVLQATFSVKSFAVSLLEKGTSKMRPLPLGLDSAKNYFPDSTLTLTPFGRIIKNDAPETKLPVRLPGLDAKHLPDMTALLIEFPVLGFGKDVAFTYTRKFSDSEPTFEVTYRGKDETGEKFDVTMKQTYVSWEDSTRNTADKKDAASRVDTRVEGHGVVWFDEPNGKMIRASLKADAQSSVVSLVGEAERKRSLRTIVEITKGNT